jgi:hypothetical protein
MVHPSLTLVLRSLVLCSTTSRYILVNSLVVVPLGCLWVALWALVGIMTTFSTLKTSTRLYWGSCIVIVGRCVHDASLTILLVTTRPLTGLSTIPLLVLVLVASLSLLSRALHLIIIISTLFSKAKPRTLRVVLWTSVPARLSLKFSLAIR